VEPVTGEKRQREDGDQNGIPHPSSRSSSGGSGAAMNSNYISSITGGGAQVQAMAGYDALYIGDLQWVGCPVVHYLSRFCSEAVILSFLLEIISGQQMKICAKLH